MNRKEGSDGGHLRLTEKLSVIKKAEKYKRKRGKMKWKHSETGKRKSSGRSGK